MACVMGECKATKCSLLHNGKRKASSSGRRLPKLAAVVTTLTEIDGNAGKEMLSGQVRPSFEPMRGTIPSRCCRSPFYTYIYLDDESWVLCFTTGT